MTNAIERLKELVRLGEKATPGVWPSSFMRHWHDRATADFCTAAANARPDIAKLLEVIEAASKGVHKLDPLRAVIEIAERDGNLKALNPEVLARRLISEFEYQDAIRAALRNLETKETSDA